MFYFQSIQERERDKMYSVPGVSNMSKFLWIKYVITVPPKTRYIDGTSKYKDICILWLPTKEMKCRCFLWKQLSFISLYKTYIDVSYFIEKMCSRLLTWTIFPCTMACTGGGPPRGCGWPCIHPCPATKLSQLRVFDPCLRSIIPHRPWSSQRLQN